MPSDQQEGKAVPGSSGGLCSLKAHQPNDFCVLGSLDADCSLIQPMTIKVHTVRNVRPCQIARVLRKLYHLLLNFPKYGLTRFEKTLRRIAHYCSVVVTAGYGDQERLAEYFSLRCHQYEDLFADY